MRSVWIWMLLCQLALGEYTSKFCARGFQKVLESKSCQYFAYGPHFMSSYCQWDQQIEYGITTNFCCGGICAYCFQDISSIIDGIDSSPEYGMAGTEPDYFVGYNKPDESTEISPDERALGELIAVKLEHMINMLQKIQVGP